MSSVFATPVNLLGRVLLFMTMLVCLSACPAHQQDKSVSAEGALAGDTATLLRQGDVARSLGKQDEAIRFYEAAAEQSTGGVLAHLELAGLYRAAGRTTDAIAIMKTAYDLNPQNVEVLKALAQALLEGGEGREAGRYLARGLAQSPDDVRLINAYGVWLDQMGQHGDAQGYYQKALKLSKTSGDIYGATNNLALSQIAGKQPDAAIATLNTLPEKLKNSASYRQTLALAYGVKGNTEKAYELSLEDLTAEEARDNLLFYERYRADAVARSVLFKDAADQANFRQ